MKFQPPRGTRDFLPEEMRKREWMVSVIKDVAGRYGFETISTPGIESWELLGKKGGGGEEIKKEIYVFKDKAGREIGLRFEFTVSFARFLASNPQLPKPFKRYQIGPVWRYDRPQAGRYREFLCCEMDIAGSGRPEADAEIMAVTCEIFRGLGFKDFRIRLSNRKLVEGLIRAVGVERDKVIDVFRSIDKLDKIGPEGVTNELQGRGIEKKVISRIMDFIGIQGNFNDVLNKAGKIIGTEDVGKEGLENLREVVRVLGGLGFEKNIVADLSIVRGLEYYTGCVFEIAVAGGKLSLGGGGRYDKLVELYGGQPTPCVGIGIGFERMYDYLDANGMFSLPLSRTEVLVINVSEKFLSDASRIAGDLRKQGISCETDVMGRPLRKQLEYANSRKIPWAVFVGEKEVKARTVTLRDMKTGKEAAVSLSELVKKVS